MERKPVILVTYRNRPTHLSCLTLHMKEYFSNIPIIVLEQIDDLPWNKGLLYNIGFQLFEKEYDYFILHDVDFIPVQDKVDYSFCEVPTMIAGEASQFDYKLLYPTFFGGVIILSKEHYKLINGFSNLFQGYGGEDDHFYKSFLEKGIQPKIKNGRFECFAHPRPKDPILYNHNLEILNKSRDFSEGLSTIPKNIVYLQERKKNYFIHVKINTNG